MDSKFFIKPSEIEGVELECSNCGATQYSPLQGERKNTYLCHCCNKSLFVDEGNFEKALKNIEAGLFEITQANDVTDGAITASVRFRVRNSKEGQE